ncbi:MAG TPA: polysaccharide biosynthesis protein [Bacilli bacterium]
MKADSLVKGTIILTLAAFVARFLGAIQRVPLKALLTDAGMATYSIAYNVYFILLTIATAGVPLALSKLISERNAVGKYAEAQRIFVAAVWFSLTAGVLMTALIYVAAPFYAERMSQDPDAALAIRALAPALLLFPLIAIMRGYFLGHRFMLANGMSQMIEQIVRVVTAVGLAYALLRLGFGHRWAVAGASFGGVTGAVGAFLVMLAYKRKIKPAGIEAAAGADRRPAKVEMPDRETELQSGKPLKIANIYSLIFRISIPITLISIMVPLINAIDSTTTIPLLKADLGIGEAKVVLGLLGGRAQSLAGIPIILAIALSQSVIPVISSAFARKDVAELRAKTSQALRLSILSGLPLVVMLATGAKSINGLLFADTAGSGIIAMLTVASMFQIVMMTSGSILMGLGQMRAPMAHVFLGIAVKLAGNYILAPWFGIYGIITATIAAFLLTTALNLRSLGRIMDFSIFGKRWPGMAAAAALTTVAGILLDRVNMLFVHLFGGALDYLLQSALLCTALLLLYGLLLPLLRVLTKEDLSAMPGPLRKLSGKIPFVR